MLEARLRRETRGEVLFDAASRGRYATDASIYQIMPKGVFVPTNADDVATAIAIARESNTPVLPRGAGTSQCGQTHTRNALNRIYQGQTMRSRRHNRLARRDNGVNIGR